MVSKTVNFCDLHDEAEEVRATDSTSFTIGDKSYDIDLCPEHAEEWQALEQRRLRFADAAREIQVVQPTRRNRKRADDTAPTQPGEKVAAAFASREENQRIREWGKQNGWRIGDRGRISDELRASYRKARDDFETRNAQRDAGTGFQQGQPLVQPRPQHPRVPTIPRAVPVLNRPTPTPPAANDEGRRLDPNAAMATHSEGTGYRHS